MRKIVNFKNACRLCMFLMLLSLTACGGGAVMFAPVNEGMAIKPGRMAVIAGETDLVGTNLVKKITNRLKENTSFTVLSQDEIEKKISNYPFEIKTVYDKKAHPPFTIEKGEMKKLKKIKDTLKVDYLFVVWGRDLGHLSVQTQQGSSDSYSVTVIGNMIRYPKEDLVAYTNFRYTRNAKFIEFITLKKPNWHAEKILDVCAAEVVDNFIKNTKTGKGK